MVSMPLTEIRVLKKIITKLRGTWRQFDEMPVASLILPIANSLI
jgi:hypothetical protein